MQLPVLHSRFVDGSKYQEGDGSKLQPMPFNFERLSDDRYVALSMTSDYAILNRRELDEFLHGQMLLSNSRAGELIRKHLAYTEKSLRGSAELLSAGLAGRHSILKQFAELHIFVTTLRCDHSCPYCQVSRVNEGADSSYDMSTETADLALQHVMQSPSDALTIEFQGGESLLNFDLVMYVVRKGSELAAEFKKNIQFVVATNLSPVTREMAEFLRDNNVLVSTSLDGPADLHNKNRPKAGNDSHDRFFRGLELCRQVIGHDRVSALMTTTKRSLSQPAEVIDEYVRLGFRSVFLRWLSPYGFALKTRNAIGYEPGDFNQFFDKGLEYILNLNREGFYFREEYSTIVLEKLLANRSPGYVDLMSPASLGNAAVVYNYNGDVHVSDESRMLAENGDNTFRLGVVEDDYKSLFCNPENLSLLQQTMIEATPMCNDCGFQTLCGTDPVFHYATQGDPIGHRPTSAFCSRNMHVFKRLIDVLENGSSQDRRILESWVFDD